MVVKIIFPAIIKSLTQLFVFLWDVGMGHDTLHVAFNMFYAMPTTMSSKVRKMGE